MGFIISVKKAKYEEQTVPTSNLWQAIIECKFVLHKRAGTACTAPLGYSESWVVYNLLSS